MNAESKSILKNYVKNLKNISSDKYCRYVNEM